MLRQRRIKSARGRLSLPRAGNAGLIATAAMAFAGVAVGAVSAYLGERGARANAARTIQAEPVHSRPEPAFLAERERVVAKILTEPARLIPPSAPLAAYRGASPVKPKVIIVIDDMGVDPLATKEALKLPGPITFSFLPYARGVSDMTAKARQAGAEIMLHLPMEPQSDADPGPHALNEDMTGAQFMKALEWNLARFDGYVGVNNHMGSKLSADLAAMKTLLGYLDHKGLFYLDSVTTSDTQAREAARALGVDVYSRDVFIDAEVGNEEAIRSQLALVERIARETGYAVAIGHPRPETLAVLGPWMTTAPARGFDLVYASTLKTNHNNATPKAMAAAPSLRL